MEYISILVYLLIGAGFANYLDCIAEEGIDHALWFALTVGWFVVILTSSFMPKRGKDDDNKWYY